MFLLEANFHNVSLFVSKGSRFFFSWSGSVCSWRRAPKAYGLRGEGEARLEPGVDLLRLCIASPLACGVRVGHKQNGGGAAPLEVGLGSALRELYCFF